MDLEKTFKIIYKSFGVEEKKNTFAAAKNKKSSSTGLGVKSKILQAGKTARFVRD
jgi:hypothetical protein